MWKPDQKTKRILLVALPVLLVAAIPLGYASHLQLEVYQRYGESPGFQSRFEPQPDGSFCTHINSVYPKARWNWRGEVWQDEHLYWEDIRIDHRPGVARDETGILQPSETVVIPHNHTGPMTRGDRVCDLEDIGTYLWVYIPEEKVIFTLY